MILGPTLGVTTMWNKVPQEQAVERKRLRPGSGYLDVELILSGPSRVLVVRDHKNKESGNNSGMATRWSPAGMEETLPEPSLSFSVVFNLNRVRPILSKENYKFFDKSKIEVYKTV